MENDLDYLKARAYDAMVQVQEWQKKLNEFNKQIGEFKENKPIGQIQISS